jgi:MGT family glycosyltransferase
VAPPLTVLFMPESAFGPTNQCIGLGDVLRRRGHRVVFAAEASWRGRLTPLGFDEDLVDLGPPSDGPDEQDAGAFWKDFIRTTAPEFRKPTLAQLETFIRPTWQALVDGARYCEPQLRDILDRTRPDVVVLDNVVGFPALLTCGAPYVRIVSCNPLEVPGAGVPPAFSGYPADDPSGWAGFRAEYDRTHRDLWEDFNAWVVAQGAPPLADLQFVHESDVANLYLVPEEADYVMARPLGPTWHRMDSSVREVEEPAELPASLLDRPAGSALVYLSLGSLGSADVELMRRLIDVLSRTPHRYVVSLGPQHADLRLPPTMWGAEFLPQTTIVPLVDLVITHGGNNTTTEALHFGKPTVLLPLFWDQYDNAQRLDELGLGVRLPAYEFTEAQLHGAIEDLLGDDQLRARLDALGAGIRSRDGLRRGAEVIESVGRAHQEQLAGRRRDR